MNRDVLIKYILESDIFNKWHWFRYHFQFYQFGLEHHFARSIVDALINIEEKIEGYSILTIDRLASISGVEKCEPHYEQLLQVCSEIYIFNQAASYFKNSTCKFKYEPTCGDSNKNPEFTIEFDDYTVGIEVKQPSLFNHIRKRGNNPFQVSTRVPGFLDALKQSYDLNKITLPRDNPVKDFLISANDKFKNFKRQDNFYSILFIIWDDFIYEPISAMTGNPSGLFCEGSFARDDTGKPLIFESVDAVFVDRQLVQIISATRDTPLLYNKKHAMDYGTSSEFPHKVFIRNPDSSAQIPSPILDCFQVFDLDSRLGAEYVASDFIIWFNNGR